jgi:hypothetical protein
MYGIQVSSHHLTAKVMLVLNRLTFVVGSSAGGRTMTMTITNPVASTNAQHPPIRSRVQQHLTRLEKLHTVPQKE